MPCSNLWLLYSSYFPHPIYKQIICLYHFLSPPKLFLWSKLSSLLNWMMPLAPLTGPPVRVLTSFSGRIHPGQQKPLLEGRNPRNWLHNVISWEGKQGPGRQPDIINSRKLWPPIDCGDDKKKWLHPYPGAMVTLKEAAARIGLFGRSWRHRAEASDASRRGRKSWLLPSLGPPILHQALLWPDPARRQLTQQPWKQPAGLPPCQRKQQGRSRNGCEAKMLRTGTPAPPWSVNPQGRSRSW